MYNENIKNEFINQAAKSAVPKLKSLFSNTEANESVLAKDLCDHSLQELEFVLSSLKPSNKNIAKENVKLIEKYIDFCITKGIAKSNFNPFMGIPENWSEIFVLENQSK